VNKTTLYLPDNLQRALRQAARRTGRSQADIVREAVERYLRGEEVPRFRSMGVAADGTLSAEDVEAWLERTWNPR
jgi:predicted DNA-binding protein